MKINWEKYTVRTCMSLHECKLCSEKITLGEIYYDGGYGRRAHVACVEDPKEAPREQK